jgi:hypothetical protein
MFGKFITKAASFVGLITILSLVVVATAQDPTVCPPNALLSFTRAGAVCQDVGPDTFCYGNGTAASTLQGTQKAYHSIHPVNEFRQASHNRSMSQRLRWTLPTTVLFPVVYGWTSLIRRGAPSMY